MPLFKEGKYTVCITGDWIMEQRGHILFVLNSQNLSHISSLLQCFRGWSYFSVIKLHIYTFSKIKSHPCKYGEGSQSIEQTPVCPSFEDRVISVRYLILFIFFPRRVCVSSLPKCFSEHCSCVARGSFTYICSKNNVEYLSPGIKKKKTKKPSNYKLENRWS